MIICKVCGGIMFSDPGDPFGQRFFCPNCGHRGSEK